MNNTCAIPKLKSHHFVPKGIYITVYNNTVKQFKYFFKAPRFRHALRLTPKPRECSVSQSARTHTSHTGCVRTQSLGHGCVQEVKKRYKYCSFSHTNRSFRVLGHQCVVTMGNGLIWISLCMFFSPLIETVTYTCHYMTDRLERFDLKTSKLDLLKKKRHLHLGCP